MLEDVRELVDGDYEAKVAAVETAPYVLFPGDRIEGLWRAFTHGVDEVGPKSIRHQPTKFSEPHSLQGAGVLEHLTEHLASRPSVSVELALADRDDAVLVNRRKVDAAALGR